MASTLSMKYFTKVFEQMSAAIENAMAGILPFSRTAFVCQQSDTQH